ncbi:MAG: MgtC/SapB family protein, partial [Sphaerochaetaceae bacterium]
MLNLSNEVLGLNMSQLTPVTIILRVFIAIICSGVLGFERTRKRRPAGVRTYMLVCLGAALTMMTSQYVAINVGDTDVTRLGAQVISGIGFIGAGTIICTGYHQIKGLTTAAGLWASACMGLAIGIGFIYGAIVTCIAMFFVMTLMDKTEHDFLQHSHQLRIFVLFHSVDGIKQFILF